MKNILKCSDSKFTAQEILSDESGFFFCEYCTLFEPLAYNWVKGFFIVNI